MDFEQTIRGLKEEENFFSAGLPIYISRSPGRLDLMGGNDDYTGGLVFETTIREATYAAAQWREELVVEIINRSAGKAGWQERIFITLDELTNQETVRKLVNRSPAVRWTAYVLGNIFYLKQKYPASISGGLTIYIDSEVPLNRGVSSSAAVEVAVMKACAAVYKIDLTGVALSLACQWVENTIAESACGIMDQVAVVTGRKGYVMPLVCQPCNPEPLIQLPAGLSVWGIDSGVSHQVSGIEYEAARAAAFMGYKIICDSADIPVFPDSSEDIERFTDPVWNGYLANLSVPEYFQKFENLLPVRCTSQEYLTRYNLHVDPFTPLKEAVWYNVRANTTYAVEENQRVQLFAELSKGSALTRSHRSWQLMGELMYQSHQAYSDCGLGSKATDILVGICQRKGIAAGVYGAKITGGGAGGTVAILADTGAGDVIKEILLEYTETGSGEPFLFEGSSDGADAYGILVI